MPWPQRRSLEMERWQALRWREGGSAGRGFGTVVASACSQPCPMHASALAGWCKRRWQRSLSYCCAGVGSSSSCLKGLFHTLLLRKLEHDSALNKNAVVRNYLHTSSAVFPRADGSYYGFTVRLLGKAEFKQL